MQKTVFTIHVQTAQKTGPRGAGDFDMSMHDGQKSLTIANVYMFDHDRPLWKILKEDFLPRFKPNVIICLGRLIHDRCFYQLAPRDLQIDRHPMAPEVVMAREASNIWEQRFVTLGEMVGNEIRDLLKAAGPQANFIYVPASHGQTPPDLNLYKVIKQHYPQVLAWRQSHPKEAPNPEEIPYLPRLPDREEFELLLGVEGEKHIHVMPFGASVTVHGKVVIDGKETDYDQVKFEVGDKRVMKPGTISYKASFANNMPTICGYPGMMATGWYTSLRNTLNNVRRQMMFSEVGNLMDSRPCDYIDDGFRPLAKGWHFGQIFRGVYVGMSFPFKRGGDMTRAMMPFGHVFGEDEPGGLATRGTIELAGPENESEDQDLSSQDVRTL